MLFLLFNYMNYIVNYLFNYKNKNYQINECSNITQCYQITNKCCKNINYFRQYQTTKQKTIVVGLELPNKQGKLIRFIPRNITIINKQS